MLNIEMFSLLDWRVETIGILVHSLYMNKVSGITELNHLEVLTVEDCPISEVSFANVEKVQGGKS